MEPIYKNANMFPMFCASPNEYQVFPCPTFKIEPRNLSSTLQKLGICWETCSDDQTPHFKPSKTLLDFDIDDGI